MQQKRVAAIHDISCFGKCSLTVAGPILSAAGIETSVIPTAVPSTHTGGFMGFTFRDLSDDILPVVNHWQENKISFDALYSGYLGSAEQIEIMKKVFTLLKTENTKIVIDPVMADNGKLYGGFPETFPAKMKDLCKLADIITPNITEAVFMLGEEYKEGPYTKEYIEGLIKKLTAVCGKDIVLTGVYFNKEELGAAVYNHKTGKIDYVFNKKIDAAYHGTGDCFTSAILAALLNGKTLTEATAVAVKFTVAAIKETKENYPTMWYGVNFESKLPLLSELIK